MSVYKYALPLLCVASFIIATVVARTVFDMMPHVEDEHAYLYQAEVFATGHVTAETPPQPESFFVAFVLDRDGKRFGKYPPGFPFLLALGVLLRQPWLVNSAAAALGLLAVYLLGRDLFDRTTGLVAALLGLFSPLYILLSGTLLSHHTTLVALTLFAWAFIRARRLDEPRRLQFAALAGVLLGLAAISRPFTALAVGFPFAVLVLWDVARRRGRPLPVYAVMGVLCAAVALALPWYNWATTGSPLTNLYTLWWKYDKVGFGQGYGRWNHTLLDGLDNTRIMLGELQTMLTGWPVLFGVPLVGVVLAFGLGWPPFAWRDWGILMPAVVLIVAHMAYWMPSFGMFGPRYYSEAGPFLWLVLARGLIKMGETVWSRRAVMVAVPLLIAWGQVYVTMPRLQADVALYDISRLDEQRVAAAAVRNALVFVETPDWTNYASLSWLNRPRLSEGNIIYAEDMGAAKNSLVAQAFPGRTVYYYSRLRGPVLVAYEP